MNKRVLIIIDKLDNSWMDEAIGRNESHQYEVLTLGFGAKASLHINRNRYEKLRSVNFVNVDRFAEPAQEKIRKFVPKFVYEFPRKDILSGESLINLLRVADRFNLWWFMEMSEKGALRTSLIKRIYYLELIKTAISEGGYHEVWLELNDTVLRETLMKNKDKFPLIKQVVSKIKTGKLKRNTFWVKLFKRLLVVNILYLFRWLLLRILGIKRIKIAKRSILFFSLFPYFWIKSSEYGLYENFFRTAPWAAGEKFPAYYALWVSDNPLSLWKKRKDYLKVYQAGKMIFVETYLNILDYLKTFYFSIQYVKKLIRYWFKYKPKIHEFYENIDITRIVISELEHSLCSFEIFNCIYLMKAMEKLTSVNEIVSLIYRIEFQPHERAIEYGAEDRCLTIGFQHQAIGRNHLQYFFPKREIDHYYSEKDNPDNLPIPDKIMVTGEYPFEVLREDDFAEDAIKICGPVRYADLVKSVKNGRSKEKTRVKYGYDIHQNIFLVATPSVRIEMLNLVLALLNALKSSDISGLFLFKSHPVYKYDEEVIRLIWEIYPAMKYSFLPDGININDYLILSDALLLTGTTVGVEAICLGTMPILFENNATFSLNPLLEIKNSYLSVCDSPTMEQAIRDVLSNDGRLAEIRRNWPSAIKKIFYDIENDPNKKFCSIIDEYIKARS